MKRKLITFSRIIRTGIINFFRNLSLAVAAIAVMVVTLTIILLSVVINTTLSHTISQITDKIDVSVYLVDGIDAGDRDAFLVKIKSLPNVASVSYLDKDAVLNAYKQDNANNPALLQAIGETDNPLPATIRIKPVDLNKVSDIQKYLESPKAKQYQSEEPSYSGDRKEAIDNISHAADVLQRVGIAGVIIFALVSVLIIFNTLQMAIFNRRDEIAIMRLLGASTRYIRGPFIVEGIMYGVIAALVSTALVKILFVASDSTLQASSLGLLDIGYAADFFNDNFWVLVGFELLAGVAIGAISSSIATRRYLKFKVSKR